MHIDIAEALRYLGAGRGADDVLRTMTAEIAAALEQRVQPQYVFRVFPLGDGVLELTGDLARRMLEDCTHAAVLVCTLGAGFETMLRAQQARDMARAVVLDACGSAYVEAGCDACEEALRARFPDKHLTDRFSPGYGDLPLALQPRLLELTDARRRLGVTVTESLLMLPTKTVTAIVGLADAPQPARIRGCGYCNLRATCTLRKGGATCGEA